MTKFITRTRNGKCSLQMVDISDPANPVLLGVIDPMDNGTNSSAVTSVTVSNGLIAIAVPNDTKTDAGNVLLYEASPMPTFLASFEVGALPDMVTFTPDGSRILVANEGESADGDNDPTVLPNPEGSVSIITLNLSDLPIWMRPPPC